MSKILVEICCGCLEDALVAQQNKADRIELNSAFFLGGLTPTLGTFLAAKAALSIPIMVMIRPREAGFDYSEFELDVMRRDAKIFLEHDADGLVFGFLRADGTIDAGLMREFTDMCHRYGKTAVCHRAFDVTPDPLAALETLIETGVDRVLTSGQAPIAPDGAELIRTLIERAGNRIEILPGAGLNAQNAARFVEFTGTRQIHYAAMKLRAEHSTRANPSIYFGGALFPREDVISVADGAQMQAIWSAVEDK